LREKADHFEVIIVTNSEKKEFCTI
jgi:hypothetical protein